MRRTLPFVAALGLLVPAWPAPATSDAGVPPNYADRTGLSTRAYSTVRETLSVPMRDGVGLHAEVVRPAAAGAFPVIVEMSPGNGEGQRNGNLPGLPDEDNDDPFGTLAGYFGARGYAVVLADARGTGESAGCADFLGPTASTDGYDLVEWLAQRPWAAERVAMVGMGEDGSLALATASAEPAHLSTVVAVSAPAQVYDYRYQGGVGYHPEWIGLLGISEQGWIASTITPACDGQERQLETAPDALSGRHTAWHAEHDYRAAVEAADVPIFTVQGLGEHGRATASDWRRARGVPPGDKLWLGQWGQRTSDRAAQWPGVLHRWLDAHLHLLPADTGPPVEVFLNPQYQIENIGDLNDPENAIWRGKVRTASEWPGGTRQLTLYPKSDRRLSLTPPSPHSEVWLPSPTGRGMWFESPVFSEDTIITGVPEIILDALMTERVDLSITVWEVGFSLRVITQAALNPELRNGDGTWSPVVPGLPMRLRPAAHPLDYQIHAGSFLRVFVSSNDPDKAPLFGGPAATVFAYGGSDPPRITFDVVDDVVLHTDPRP